MDWERNWIKLELGTCHLALAGVFCSGPGIEGGASFLFFGAIDGFDFTVANHGKKDGVCRFVGISANRIYCDENRCLDVNYKTAMCNSYSNM